MNLDSQNPLLEVGWIILSSLALGILSTPVAMWIAKKARVVDYPGKSSHTIHQKEITRAGGIALALALGAATILDRFFRFPEITHIFLPALIILTFGLWDDRSGMNAPVKLAGQVSAVTLLVLSGIRVQFFENPQFFIRFIPTVALWVDILITYFWVIGITNAFNLVDSMDGLALGMGQITSAFFLIAAYRSGQTGLLFLSCALFGVSLGIYFFNRYPARTFLGDSGAQTLGFILSAVAIIYRPKAISQSSTWFVPIIVFSVPIFDTTLVTISRILKGLPFYKANLDHTYHRLVALGWKENHSVSIMHIAAILNGLLAVLCVSLQPLTSNILFGLWILVFLFLLIFLEKKFVKVE